jgi:hypothetical protein
MAVVAILVGAFALAGCGSEVGRTALVPRNPRWISPTTLQVDVECADRLTVKVAIGAGTEQLPLVTIWGEPNREGCWTPVVLTLPPGTERLDDAASGTVVDLPPAPTS